MLTRPKTIVGYSCIGDPIESKGYGYINQLTHW